MPRHGRQEGAAKESVEQRGPTAGGVAAPFHTRARTPDDAGSRAAVLLNGLGSTQYEEMLVLYKDVHDLLTVAGVDIYRPIVNEMVTSLDMAGCSLSLLWLDEELQPLLDAPCASAAFTQ